MKGGRGDCADGRRRRSWEEAENGERKCTPHNQLPPPLQGDSTLQTGLEPLEPDSSSLFKALAIGAREPRRFGRRSTISPPVTFFCALRISISAGLIDPLAFLSSFGRNSLRSCDILIPMVLGEVVLVLFSEMPVGGGTWRSIKLGSMVIEEVVASSREIIVGTPVLYDTSADVPFVGLVILEVPSNPGVAFAELGEGSITVGGDSCVGELEPIVDGPHESVSGTRSCQTRVATLRQRTRVTEHVVPAPWRPPSVGRSTRWKMLGKTEGGKRWMVGTPSRRDCWSVGAMVR
ncbi:hypothetical protein L210DRAFT_3073971 [Boletus edulis BED1]|uniref:Uncharacterized protein n=1 Tax=Boletus edulis BED1 TaxID=1328754 RepID=A0AAD4BGN2_BOLED|nr:hypothetical protein L210DRAFT_3073971 [Boletus edulis BED1]